MITAEDRIISRNREQKRNLNEQNDKKLFWENGDLLSGYEHWFKTSNYVKRKNRDKKKQRERERKTGYKRFQKKKIKYILNKM